VAFVTHMRVGSPRAEKYFPHRGRRPGGVNSPHRCNDIRVATAALTVLTVLPCRRMGIRSAAAPRGPPPRQPAHPVHRGPPAREPGPGRLATPMAGPRTRTRQPCRSATTAPPTRVPAVSVSPQPRRNRPRLAETRSVPAICRGCWSVPGTAGPTCPLPRSGRLVVRCRTPAGTTPGSHRGSPAGPDRGVGVGQLGGEHDVGAPYRCGRHGRVRDQGDRLPGQGAAGEAQCAGRGAGGGGRRVDPEDLDGHPLARHVDDHRVGVGDVDDPPVERGRAAEPRRPGDRRWARGGAVTGCRFRSRRGGRCRCRWRGRVHGKYSFSAPDLPEGATRVLRDPDARDEDDEDDEDDGV